MTILNLFDGLYINQMLILGPIIVLILTMVLIALIFKVLFQNYIPSGIYNYLIGPVCLIGFLIWAFPMNLGFYELFK